MSERPRVAVVMRSAAPYQVELFDRLARRGHIYPVAFYLTARSRGRRWGVPPMAHDAFILDGGSVAERVEVSVASADLVVFGYYRHAWARAMMKRRSLSGRPWCFWGERPGYRHRGWLGRVGRRLLLSPLYRSRVPIWGIGRWAVSGYRAEFGDQRDYVNLPYFSDLDRFMAERRSRGVRQWRRHVLFSGELSQRKGVDVLARALQRILPRHRDVCVSFLGDGELRPSLEKLLGAVDGPVNFLGFRDWSHLPGVYLQTDLLCVPSRYDGWGMVVPEGLAAGLPVIATDCMGSALELLTPGRNGWLARAGDVASLADALEEAVTMSDERLVAMSDAARQSVATHHLDDGARRFEEAVMRALKA